MTLALSGWSDPKSSPKGLNDSVNGQFCTFAEYLSTFSVSNVRNSCCDRVKPISRARGGAAFSLFQRREQLTLNYGSQQGDQP